MRLNPVRSILAGSSQMNHPITYPGDSLGRSERKNDGHCAMQGDTDYEDGIET